MLGFPVPYQNELLYSTIARAGIHDGETSHKQLLDSVFGNRKVIATVDLPCHIKCIANQYPYSLALTSGELVDSHTLWPIYAPFLPRDRRLSIEYSMGDASYGAAHLASGIAASRIKSNKSLLVCHVCIVEQEKFFGEAYWDRRWQVPLIRCCPKHGPLHKTNILLNNEHRHEFKGVSTAIIYDQLEVTGSDIRFAKIVNELFQTPPHKSPTYDQWTQFYYDFAITHAYQIGKRIDHNKINAQFCAFWGRDWLRKLNLLPSEKDTSWLKGIFRKHRKSFSFAEHLTVITALSDGDIGITKAIASAMRYPLRLNNKKVVVKTIPDISHPDQVLWMTLLKSNRPKQARQLEPALYTRLYRAHYNWLMNINQEHYGPSVQVKTRVDWSQRDRETARVLQALRQQLGNDLTAPRLTKSYLLRQLPNRTVIEKNLHRLPRCHNILKKYSESIADYQARRLSRALTLFHERGHAVKRWTLLRAAGLSDERITDTAIELLSEILKSEET